MVRAAVPHMSDVSATVMTGSVTGVLGNKDLLDYSMTKGGMWLFGALYYSSGAYQFRRFPI